MSRLLPQWEADSAYSTFACTYILLHQPRTNLGGGGIQFPCHAADDITLNVSGSEIRPSKSVKILGVTIDQTLSWENHISAVVSKCFGSLIPLNRFRHHLTPEALQLIIQTHVLSHVNYCLPVWGGASKAQQARVQRALICGPSSLG